MVTPRPDTLAPYLQRFPDLPFIIDHIGIAWPAPDTPPTERYRRLEPIRELSKYPNLHLKWSHIERLAADPYPYPDLIPHFRTIVDAYGPERILWASDHTQAIKQELSPHPAPYSHSLHYLLDADAFSHAEKEWILGRTTRTVLRWPS
jgi:predicted TIM-barrel fold metal-dependent hydrolase